MAGRETLRAPLLPSGAAPGNGGRATKAMSGYEESDTVPLAEEGLFDGSLAGSLSTQLQAEKPSGGVP